jgi:RNA polymerase sigma-70 factor (ECF subfamily)
MESRIDQGADHIDSHRLGGSATRRARPLTMIRRRSSATGHVPQADAPLRKLEDGRNITCAALLLATVQGDRAALTRLYELTIDRVTGIVSGVLETLEDQQEVISDIYTFIWKSAAIYDPKRGSVDAWMSVITKNRAVDHYRRGRRIAAVNRRYDQEVQASLSAEAPGADQILTQDQSCQELQRAIRSLPPVRRHLIGLAFFRDMSHVDIASATGIPIGTVKSHVRRALASLRSEIAAYT